MTETIYARVPKHVKAAAVDHAAKRGTTLASAVADLLDQGLQASSDASSVAALEKQVESLTADNATLRQRDLALSAAYQGLAERTAQPVGACPKCEKPITGHDLLIAGHCPQCGTGLTGLLGTTNPPSAKGPGVNDGDLKVLLGALGLLLGIAFVSQGTGGG